MKRFLTLVSAFAVAFALTAFIVAFTFVALTLFSLTR